MAGSRKSGEEMVKLRSGTESRLPGHFVSSDLQADTARFLEDLKTRIRIRAEAEQPSLTKPFSRVQA